MNILAFELANFSFSYALMKAGDLVVYKQREDYRAQDALLVSVLEKAMAEHHLAFQDLDRIVTTTGPGSFTGIRIALATAQGLGLAAQVPTVGIGSLPWVAVAYGRQKHVLGNLLVILKSLRHELYGQLFDPAGKALEAPFSLEPADIIQRYKREDCVCIGNGASCLQEYGFSVDPFMPTTKDLVLWAQGVPKDILSLYPCLPTYVRDADTTCPLR